MLADYEQYRGDFDPENLKAAGFVYTPDSLYPVTYEFPISDQGQATEFYVQRRVILPRYDRPVPGNNTLILPQGGHEVITTHQIANDRLARFEISLQPMMSPRLVDTLTNVTSCMPNDDRIGIFHSMSIHTLTCHVLSDFGIIVDRPYIGEESEEDETRSKSNAFELIQLTRGIYVDAAMIDQGVTCHQTGEYQWVFEQGEVGFLVPGTGFAIGYDVKTALTVHKPVKKLITDMHAAVNGRWVSRTFLRDRIGFSMTTQPSLTPEKY